MDFNYTMDQRIFADSVRGLSERHFSKKAFTWFGKFPWENLKILAENDLLGLIIPVEDGGQGGSLVDCVIAILEISRVDPQTADVFHIGNLGAMHQLALFGNEYLKKEVLPKLLRGETIISACMSEPNVGSSVSDLQTTARIEGDEVVINGTKLFSTNGHYAGYFTVWCKFGEGVRTLGIVIAPNTAPGFSRGKKDTYMSGDDYMPIYFDNCRVPKEYIMVPGGEFGKLIRAHNVARVGNSARSLAVAINAYERSLQYSKERIQFQRPLCEFQGLQWKMADMKLRIEQSRWILFKAASAEDGIPSALDSSLAKLSCNETAEYVCREAIQIHGAYGLSNEFPLSYLYGRARGWMIAGGSVEMMRNRVASEIYGRRFSQRPPKAKTT